MGGDDKDPYSLGKIRNNRIDPERKPLPDRLAWATASPRHPIFTTNQPPKNLIEFIPDSKYLLENQPIPEQSVPDQLSELAYAFISAQVLKVFEDPRYIGLEAAAVQEAAGKYPHSSDINPRRHAAQHRYERGVAPAIARLLVSDISNLLVEELSPKKEPTGALLNLVVFARDLVRLDMPYKRLIARVTANDSPIREAYVNEVVKALGK